MAGLEPQTVLIRALALCIEGFTLDDSASVVRLSARMKSGA